MVANQLSSQSSGRPIASTSFSPQSPGPACSATLEDCVSSAATVATLFRAPLSCTHRLMAFRPPATATSARLALSQPTWYSDQSLPLYFLATRQQGHWYHPLPPPPPPRHHLPPLLATVECGGHAQCFSCGSASTLLTYVGHRCPTQPAASIMPDAVTAFLANHCSSSAEVTTADSRIFLMPKERMRKIPSTPSLCSVASTWAEPRWC